MARQLGSLGVVDCDRWGMEFLRYALGVVREMLRKDKTDRTDGGLVEVRLGSKAKRGHMV